MALDTSTSSTNVQLPPCTYCMEEMQGGVGVKCAKCVEFYICLPCFSIGAEIGSHKKNHDYFIVDCGGQARLFDEPITWTVGETVGLLDGIELHGYGNWANIAKTLPNRNADDCSSFFNDIFVNGNLNKAFNANKLEISIDDHSIAPAPSNLILVLSSLINGCFVI